MKLEETLRTIMQGLCGKSFQMYRDSKKHLQWRWISEKDHIRYERLAEIMQAIYCDDPP